MTEAPNTEDPVEDIAPADEAAEAPVEAAPDLSDKAAKLGWTPKEQFKGDPAKWVDANEFVRRGEELMPILKANNRKMEREIAGLKDTLQKFGKFAESAEKRAYDRALKDIKADHAAAVESGDIAAADDALERMSDLKAEAKAPKQSDAPERDDDFEDWVEENSWFKTDRVMKAAAIEIAEEIKDSIPDPVKQRAEVSKRMKAEFPHKFAPPANPRRSAPGAVEGAPSPGARTTGKTYSDLPSEAKAMCDDFVKRVPGFTREKFVRDFDFKGYAS